MRSLITPTSTLPFRLLLLLVQLVTFGQITTALPLSVPLPTTTMAQRDDTCRYSYPPPFTARINVFNRPDLQLKSTQTVSFSLPPEAHSCTLRVRFPPHWEVYDSSVEAGGPPLPMSIYAVDGPAAGALVGYARFAELPIGGEPTVINSFTCRETMTFRFELGGSGEVGFVTGDDPALGRGGIEMAWGC
ncbi:hypothetical protein N656DRAFT_797495 [Canariomyces notabilis]|uniref:Ubiquitin 3 binding protein But2 C-terminal domain-containing protein n=1 Tax=Canariomyces notabilis TaxID=2074819 RepID=A0AAN6TFQ8_9PEZI|nr:hypothetical protein N656DRAFT_797495 [Canariomyces arenarius]